MLKNLAVCAAIAIGSMLVGTGHADAARATVTDTVNVRAGPGTDYRVVGRLHRGDRVNVDRCDRAGRWCRIGSRHARNGWVNARYLHNRRGGGQHHRPHRPQRPGSGLCFHGAFGYVCLGN